MPFSGSRCNVVYSFNGQSEEKHKGKRGIRREKEP
jgi:hypothetical protein